VKSGKARLIAVNTPKRTPLLPDLPTVAEQGLPGFGVTVSIGLLAPAGTPAEIVNKLNAEINAVIAEPDFEERMKAVGIVREGGTPAQFGEAIRGDIERYSKIVRETGARVD
jgi:tripartite-type tricarboxylate transporter receptor subunit TctC